ncbi:hypothetical protein E2C01_042564 [Portunus trituberculatus]|uniref:Uncharacterized protein n=1 Tax=Portunus trituberculatus TaxID=210409 RepID=A0A5B7FMR2_PORTR|nr:hypothetical protein [Portunus trituberculatus]
MVAATPSLGRRHSFDQNWLRAVTALGATLREVAVLSGLGPKAGNWQRGFLYLGGIKLHYSHPLALPHNRDGVAMSRGSMSVIHQIGGVVKG